MSRLDNYNNKLVKDISHMILETVTIYKKLSNTLKKYNEKKCNYIIEYNKQVSCMRDEFHENIVNYFISEAPLAKDFRLGISLLKIADELVKICSYAEEIVGIDYDRCNCEVYLTSIVKVITIIIDQLIDLNGLMFKYEQPFIKGIISSDVKTTQIIRDYVKLASDEHFDNEDYSNIRNTLSSLEKVGKHILNIVNNVIYAVTGQHMSV